MEAYAISPSAASSAAEPDLRRQACVGMDMLPAVALTILVAA
jgi:hypothetical protein